jgi:hypothetical protein
MGKTATAQRRTERPSGALVRVFCPAVDQVPSLAGATCSFSGCRRAARQVEWVGRMEIVLTCAGHKLWTDPER